MKDDNGSSALYFAAEVENTSVVNKLLSLNTWSGHSVYGKTPLIRAIEERNSDAVKFLLSIKKSMFINQRRY